MRIVSCLLIALPGCGPIEADLTGTADQNQGGYLPPSVPWSLEGKWNLTLKRLEMFQSEDCSWSSNCGVGGGAACSGVYVFMTALKTSETEVYLKIPYAGLAGDRFTGPIDSDGVFTADHEGPWVGTEAAGEFDEDARTVSLIVHWYPTGYDCSAEIEFEGTPNF